MNLLEQNSSLFAAVDVTFEEGFTGWVIRSVLARCFAESFVYLELEDVAHVISETNEKGI